MAGDTAFHWQANQNSQQIMPVHQNFHTSPPICSNTLLQSALDINLVSVGVQEIFAAEPG